MSELPNGIGTTSEIASSARVARDSNQLTGPGGTDAGADAFERIFSAARTRSFAGTSH
jgi:hypothetical protein